MTSVEYECLEIQHRSCFVQYALDRLFKEKKYDYIDKYLQIRNNPEFINDSTKETLSDKLRGALAFDIKFYQHLEKHGFEVGDVKEGSPYEGKLRDFVQVIMYNTEKLLY